MLQKFNFFSKNKKVSSLFSTLSKNELTFLIKDLSFSSANYKLNNFDLFDFNLLTKIVKEFFKQLPNKLLLDNKTNRKFFILLKVKFNSGNYSSLHSGLVISLNSLNLYLEYLNDCLSEWSNDYKDKIVIEVIFNFFLIPVDREKHYIDRWSEIKKDQPIKLQSLKSKRMKGLFIPLNRNYLNWGKIIIDNLDLITLIYNQNTYTINKQKGTIDIYNFKGIHKLTLQDLDFNNEIFIRNILKEDGSKEVSYYIDNQKEQVILKTKEITNLDYLTPLKAQNGVMENKIITIDIETVMKDGEMIPYLFSMFDGKINKSWFTDSPKELFDLILRPKYKGYNVYAHNLSRFDIIFFFKYFSLLKLNGFKINVLKKDDNIIGIKISNRTKNISITFKDSLLILPNSLANLSKTFTPELIKGIEPVLIPGLNTDLNSKFYEQLDINHYNKQVETIKNDSDLLFQEFKSKVKNYCELDCITLYNILIKFKSLIYDRFGLDISKYPTISSISFHLFRLNYLKDNLVPITKGKIFKFLKESYTGGSTEMYIPTNKNFNTGEYEGLIYCYDVNSLYPTMMRDNLFPIGKITEFEGDITILDNKYWIGECDISTKSDLYAPYLQLHHKTKNGLRTISPNGNWNMKINSPEYFNALKDYNISIKNGYFFDQGELFKDFVNDLYNLRLQYSKSDPMNLICKLILNSLYGRFGMNPLLSEHIFVNKSDFMNICEQFEVIAQIDFDDGSFLSYINPELIGKLSKTSIGIASAVTSYSRILMSYFKNNPDYILYYTDTDSAFINKPLPDYLVGKELGQFKLEYILKKGIFLGPKIYCGITLDNEYICKVKGFKDPKSIPFLEMESLLEKDSFLELIHSKWFRNLGIGKINIKSQIYELRSTANKRQFIYENNKIVDTKAIKINKE